MTWKRFPHHKFFVRKITGYKWIPLYKGASNAELWCFLFWWTNNRVVSDLNVIFCEHDLIASKCVIFHRLCAIHCNSLWRDQMNTFFALLALCAGNSPVTGEFLAQRPVTRSFDVSFDLRMNKSWGWWFETQLWRHCNVNHTYGVMYTTANSIRKTVLRSSVNTCVQHQCVSNT